MALLGNQAETEKTNLDLNFVSAIGNFKRKLKKETKHSETADESVVVKKPRPMKAGNSLEEKTGVTGSWVCQGL